MTNASGAAAVLVDRSVTGARWTLFLGALSLPLTYLTSVFLARVSPDALGTYSLIILFQAGCMTFLAPGSEQALVRYLPRVSIHERGRLMVTYGRIPILLIVAAVVLLLLYAKPVQSLLFGSETGLGDRILPYLAILIPIVVTLKILGATLQSAMDIKGMAIATKTAPFLIFLGALILLALRPSSLLGARLPLAILGIVVTANLGSAVVAAFRSRPITRSWTVGGGSLSPPGFWSFTLLSFAGSVVAFGFGNFDLVVISNRLGVHELGLYKAALASAEFVRWIPMVLLQTVFPFFCNLLPQGDEEQVRRAYRRLIRYTFVPVGGIGLALVCFSGPILGLFGSEFAASRGSLVLLSAVFTLSAISTINGALVIAAGRVGKALLNGAVAVTLQIVLSIWLVPIMGATGAALGKAAHLICLAILDAWLAYSTLRVLVPTRVLALGTVNAGLVVVSWLFTPGSLWQIAVMGVAVLLVYVSAAWVLKLANAEDIRLALRFVLGRSATMPDLPA